MNHQITTKSSSSEVINTTSSISDISHNNSITLCESKHNNRLTVKHRMQLSPLSTQGLFTCALRFDSISIISTQLYKCFVILIT